MTDSNTLDNIGKQLVSSCHKALLKVVDGGEGTSYWICSECQQPADAYVEDNRELASDNTLDKEIRKHFVFQDDHIFDSQGDTPYLAHQCKKCDKLSSHHLQYDALSTLRDLIANREKQMLEFVIPPKVNEKTKIPSAFGDFSKGVDRGFNKAIDEIRQRAKEWKKR